MKKRDGDKRKPVTKLVQGILEQARLARAEGPASSVYRRETQMSNAITQAGMTLAKMDRGAPGRKSPLLHSLLGSSGGPAKPKARRSWFFASASAAMPDAKRIEQLLKTSAHEGKRLVLDQVSPETVAAVNDDLMCHLPEGASDPVCEPR
jgi:hypothetical protein